MVMFHSCVSSPEAKFSSFAGEYWLLNTIDQFLAGSVAGVVHRVDPEAPGQQGDQDDQGGERGWVFSKETWISSRKKWNLTTTIQKLRTTISVIQDTSFFLGTLGSSHEYSVPVNASNVYYTYMYIYTYIYMYIYIQIRNSSTTGDPLGMTQPVIKGNPWIDACRGIKQIYTPCPHSEAKGRWVLA